MFKSPFIYAGGKGSILNQLLPLFPKNIDTFYDLFGGGANVSINIIADKIICNDIQKIIIDFYNYVKNTDIEDITIDVKKNYNIIDLQNDNGKSFSILKDRYNKDRNPLDLFILSLFSFNSGMRFNIKGEFNLPFGNRSKSINEILQRITDFKNRLDKINIEFISKEFLDINIINNPNNFVYCDPPYLVTDATYNRFWSVDHEKKLLNLLDELDKKNIKFALSNVLENRGMKNEMLIVWSKKYYINDIQKNYNNCSSTIKNSYLPTREVLITNYKVENKLKNFMEYK